MEIASSLRGHTPVWDVLFLFFFLAAGFFYGVFLGRDRLLSLLIGLYISIPITRSARPFMHSILATNEYVPALMFACTAGILYMFLFASLFRGRRSRHGGWWQVLITSFLATGLAVSELARLLPASLQSKLSLPIHVFILSDIAHLVWLLLPLVGIYIASRRVA
ncbi:MAG: Uncharacterized protein G01um101470_185 [Parcubacteria group bacterium Gr01-1014_70]|nr:MAG: Uncharacterized protein G01um101470_185 [Parcubacteria group bacterium Gr01-1014_70]